MSTKEINQEKHLDSTIKVIEEHVEKGSTSGISATINAWIKALESHYGLKGIATDLEKLKEAIAAKDTKKATDLMTKLGAATVEAAEGANEQEAVTIKKLGKTLTAAAKALAKFA